MNDLPLMRTEVIPTSPKENQMELNIRSAIRFPDWVENERREKKRQEAAEAQFFKLDEKENWRTHLEDEYGNDDDGEWSAHDPLSSLLEANEDIEV